ncbi:MAG TPA: Uma2 family endonuclease [Blastocatellia bacterium]|nr:Uma2 family endonuclease [Blastocatellia bacterium]
MATHIEPLLTVADLDIMPDDGNRYEVIEGELFVSRSPSLTHQRVSGNFFHSLKTYLVENPIGEILATPGVIFSELSGVIPDLVFVSHERRNEIASGDRITGAPDLVIEIVSPGVENERRDRLAKRQLYGKHGVKEYWIVDFEKRTVEVYVLQGPTLALKSVLSEHDEVTSTVLPGYFGKVGALLSI